jgi:hypothetical protein
MTANQHQEIRDRLIQAYTETGLWGVINPAWALPEGVERGSDVHLAFLTLVYTISGGRDPVQLWNAARQTFVEDNELFNPKFLAYAKPAALKDRLNLYGLTQKPTSEATLWQRIGQALVMRAGGSLQKLLADHNHNAQQLMAMLAQSKTTFPVLSGKQTAPRWLYGLTAVGNQPLKNVKDLHVPVSPNATRALEALTIQTTKISAQAFDPVDALARYGCSQRVQAYKICLVAHECPVTAFCKYGDKDKTG